MGPESSRRRCDARLFVPGTGRWRVEGGAYLVEVGASSRDVRATAEAELGEAMAHPVIGPTVAGMPHGAGLSEDVMIMARAMALGRLAHQPGSGVTHKQVRPLLDVANGTGGAVARAAGKVLGLAGRLRRTGRPG